MSASFGEHTSPAHASPPPASPSPRPHATSSTGKLRILNDDFFRAAPPAAELVDLVVEAVPGADRHVAAREDFRREQRTALHTERVASGGKG